MNIPYISNENQLYGVTEARLTGGKGDGMRVLFVRSGGGLEFVVSLDRAADIPQLSVDGVNYCHFAACGYVAPTYYDRTGLNFLKSFTAGFLTTCGLTAVGSPCVDDGEELGLHGTVSNIPCESFGYWTENDEIHIKAVIRDAALFAHKLLLEREYVVPIMGKTLFLKDKVTNIGSDTAPFEMLYHCNMGYPLLDENSVLKIPAKEVKPRNAHAAEDTANCLRMEKPQRGYEERCYYHKLEGIAEITLENPKVNRGLKITYDTEELPFFTEWKMMGEGDYALGLEPGNCTPDGRDVMRSNGELAFLEPGQIKTHQIRYDFFAV